MILRLLFTAIILVSPLAHAQGTVHFQKKALVFAGAGACAEGCATASGEMAIRNGLTPIYVDQNTLNSQTTEEDRAELFKDVAVWIQPGGYSSSVVNKISEELKSALVDFVKQGGAYVGFCAGAFASTRYAGDMDYLGFNLMPGETSLFWNGGKMEDIIPVQWHHKKRYIYFEGGPYLEHLDGQAEVVGIYPNGQIAAAKSTIGKGRVFVTGFHPEAPQWWRDAYGMTDPDGLDFDMVDEMIDWTTFKK
jgi:glutamine amidotransferase-like uncharacterized protein